MPESVVMRRWRVFFLLAGLYNVVGGTVGFFTFERQLPRQPAYPFAFQLLFLSVIILGVAYLQVARDPLKNRNLVVIGLLTKLAGLGVSFWAIHDGQLPASSWWQPVVNDLPWAIGFALFLLRWRKA